MSDMAVQQTADEEALAIVNAVLSGEREWYDAACELWPDFALDRDDELSFGVSRVVWGLVDAMWQRDSCHEPPSSDYHIPGATWMAESDAWVMRELRKDLDRIDVLNNLKAGETIWFDEWSHDGKQRGMYCNPNGAVFDVEREADGDMQVPFPVPYCRSPAVS